MDQAELAHEILVPKIYFFNKHAITHKISISITFKQTSIINQQTIIKITISIAITNTKNR